MVDFAREALAFLFTDEQGWVFGRAARQAYPALGNVTSASIFQVTTS